MTHILPEAFCQERVLQEATAVAIIGALAVSFGEPLIANILWGVSNPFFAWHNHKISESEQAALFTVFTVIAWFGVWNLW